jgi:hypothetical protein
MRFSRFRHYCLLIVVRWCLSQLLLTNYKYLKMKRNPEKVTLRFSKKENDIVTSYPEYKNRNGKITANILYTFYEMAEKYAKENGYKDLREYFDKGGFDFETFTISINAKNGQTQNIRVDGRVFS